MDYKSAVPKEFFKADAPKPTAETVGDLMAQLQRLPSGLPIQQGFGGGCQLVVYNISEDDRACLEIEEI